MIIKVPTNNDDKGQWPLLGLTDCSSLLASSGRPGTGPRRAAPAPAFPTPFSSLQALSHVGQGDCEGLHG